jgi:hypothetical protein
VELEQQVGVRPWETLLHPVAPEGDGVRLASVFAVLHNYVFELCERCFVLLSKQFIAAAMVNGDAPGMKGVRIENEEGLILVQALEFLAQELFAERKQPRVECEHALDSWVCGTNPNSSCPSHGVACHDQLVQV